MAELCGPPPKGCKRWDFRKLSTCGLVATGIWRKAGADYKWLFEPYVIGTAISRIVRHGYRTKTWHGPDRHTLPPIGATVIIGHGLSTHALVVVDHDGDNVISVDGGQVGIRSAQSVKRLRRRWQAGILGGREIQGWVICDP